ncbi:MAG: hypothetical protein RL336_434, partial [Pseudomonadota bacterium]
MEQSSLSGAACDAPAWWLEKQLEKTQLTAAHLLETQGFYTARLTSQLSTSNACWQADLAIDQGPQAIFNTITLAGLEKDAVSAQHVDATVPSTGAPFTHARYENMKSGLIDLVQAQGFIDANWSVSKATVTLPAQNNDIAMPAKVDVELVLAAGPQYYIGEIHHQISDLDGAFLGKFHDLSPGMPLTRRTLDKAYQQLISTGYMASLAITPHYDQAQGPQIPLSIDGTPARKRTYEIGAGYATDSGPRTRGEVLWRRINARGDRARLTAKLAETAREVSGEYRRPDEDDPRNRWWSFGTSYEYDQPDTFKREKTALTATQSVRRQSTWLRTNVLQYSTEAWRIADQLGDTQLLNIGQGWQHSDADGHGRLPAGRSLNLSWRAAAKAAGSDINVVQLQAAYKSIRTLNRRWRLLGRAHVGINVV